MSDNEDAAPSLWNSEILCVKHSPREIIPEFPKSAGEGVKIRGLINFLKRSSAELCSELSELSSKDSSKTFSLASKLAQSLRRMMDLRI